MGDHHVADEDELYVDRVSLLSIAGSAESIGDELSRSGAPAAGTIENAVAAHQGTLTAIALANARERMDRKLAALGADVTGTGGRFRAVVTEYDQRELSNEERFGGPNRPG